MPIIKSAKKRQEIAIRNNARNRSDRSELATAIKKFNTAISNKDVELAEKLLPETFSVIDEEASKGIIHKNKAITAEVVSAALGTVTEIKPAEDFGFAMMT